MSKVESMLRVRLYLLDYDLDIWTEFPARINNGDSFYMDCFIGENEEKLWKVEIYDEILDSILYCKNSIWGADEKGIYQQVYLVETLSQ